MHSLEHAPAPRVSILSLPAELIAHILDYTLIGTHQFQRTRHLSNYAIVHSSFSSIAQKKLFSLTQVTGDWQAQAFAQLVQTEPRIAKEVQELIVHCEAEDGIGHWLSRILQRCTRMKSMSLFAAEVGTDVLPESEPAFPCLQHVALISLGSAVSTQVSSLRLTSVFLHVTPSFASFGAVTHLTLHNMYLTRTAQFPTFPSLRSLSYHFDNDPQLPSLQIFPLSGLSHAGGHVIDLEVGRWESYTAGWYDLTDPRIKDDLGEHEGRKPATLENFTVLESLCLLADSSHRARCYFPLLKSATLPLLATFKVKVDLGYRDKTQEVEAMAIELMSHLSSSPGKESTFPALVKLIIPDVFRLLKELEPVKDLQRELQMRGIATEYFK